MAHTRRYLTSDFAQARGYSPAVITQGGTIVWLAGRTAMADSAGKSLIGDFDGQVREVFFQLGKTLEEAGGKLGDVVSATVYITDPRYVDRLIELRREIFGHDFPTSALVAVAHLARSGMLVEVQAMAVIG